MDGELGSETIRIFIVENHPTVRGVVGELIRRTPGLMLCGEADSAESALLQFAESNPDVILVDLSLPGLDGIGLIQQLHEKYPALIALVISGYQESFYALQALKAGARGYMTKDELFFIKEAVDKVYAGEIYVSKKIRSRFDFPKLDEEE
jgi:DNA-binding NarL/FixJ family response regulator